MITKNTLRRALNIKGINPRTGKVNNIDEIWFEGRCIFRRHFTIFSADDRKGYYSIDQPQVGFTMKAFESGLNPKRQDINMGYNFKVSDSQIGTIDLVFDTERALYTIILVGFQWLNIWRRRANITFKFLTNTVKVRSAYGLADDFVEIKYFDATANKWGIHKLRAGFNNRFVCLSNCVFETYCENVYMAVEAAFINAGSVKTVFNNPSRVIKSFRTQIIAEYFPNKMRGQPSSVVFTTTVNGTDNFTVSLNDYFLGQDNKLYTGGMGGSFVLPTWSATVYLCDKHTAKAYQDMGNTIQGIMVGIDILFLIMTIASFGAGIGVGFAWKSAMKGGIKALIHNVVRIHGKYITKALAKKIVSIFISAAITGVGHVVGNAIIGNTHSPLPAAIDGYANMKSYDDDLFEVEYALSNWGISYPTEEMYSAMMGSPMNYSRAQCDEYFESQRQELLEYRNDLLAEGSAAHYAETMKNEGIFTLDYSNTVGEKLAKYQLTSFYYIKK